LEANIEEGYESLSDEETGPEFKTKEQVIPTQHPAHGPESRGWNFSPPFMEIPLSTSLPRSSASDNRNRFVMSSRTFATSPQPVSWINAPQHGPHHHHRHRHRQHIHDPSILAHLTSADETRRHSSDTVPLPSSQTPQQSHLNRTALSSSVDAASGTHLGSSVPSNPSFAQRSQPQQQQQQQRPTGRLLAAPLGLGLLAVSALTTSWGGGRDPVGEQSHTLMFMQSSSSEPLPSGAHRTLLGDLADLDNTQLAEILGWCMALIYFSSRMPQILKNIERGSVDGLSAPMFVLAILGNATYLGSILFKFTDWVDIKPILPWIVDAIGCLLLDFFILCQYTFYTRRNSKALSDSVSDSHSSADEEDHCAYEPTPHQIET